MKQYKNPDLHMHSIFSDGTDSPDVLVSCVKELGIDIFALTDHDTIKGCQRILELNDHPDFITGIEFSCREDDGKSHILGFGYDINDSGIQNISKKLHQDRVDKVVQTLDFLEKEFNIILPDNEKDEAINSNSPSHSHIAQLMIKNGYAENTDKAFDIIHEFKGKNSYTTPETAIGVILNAGGIPVLAHGVLEDGGGNLTYEQMHTRVQRFKSYGLMGLECFYSTFDDDKHNIMLSIAKSENLLVTAGSDYHGTNKKVLLGGVGINKPTFEVMAPFYESISNRIISC